MTPNSKTAAPAQSDFAWQAAVARYTRPSLRASLGQVATSLVPYLALGYLMYRSLAVSYGLTLALAVLAGGFLMRIFIIFHDCGHGSFFEAQKWNHVIGSICGVLVFTPYFEWRHAHAIHHATAGDLDRRGVGDVLTLTVEEYRRMPWWKRLGYRLYRNPLIMFLLGPMFMFLIAHRFPARNSKRRERYSVYWTNLAILAYTLLLIGLIGFDKYLLVMLPIMVVSGAAGVWMFYVQHQFEGTYWAEHGEWDYVAAALQGSSYYRLPKLLQWFTGNIGLHHIHHLSPRIPNYNLQACHDANPPFQQVTTITLPQSFRAIFFKLWDEQQRRLVGFRQARQARRISQAQPEIS
ncbi:MAG TPA: fatty acid desaturase [Anaerolineae bacterium]|nr:fatty acid desaturase [Anaerolineae bacterium]